MRSGARHVRSERVEHPARNGQFLVRVDHANRDPAGIGGDQPRWLRVARRMQLDAEKLESLADPRAEDRRILADATGEYERIQTTCLLYTSDAADERSSVDLGGRRIIKK